MMDVYRKTISWLTKAVALSAMLMVFADPPVQSQTCTFSIDLYDSFGDGWDVGSLDVLVNNVVVLNDITFANGYGPVNFTFNVGVGDVITTTYTPSFWPSENSFVISNANSSPVYSSGTTSSGPPAANYTVTAQDCAPPSGCTYKVTMWDDFGDGWNGSYLRIFINGVLTHNNVTMSGAGPVNFPFQVENGDSIHVQFYNSQSWPYECEFKFYDKNNNEIYADGLNGQTPSSNVNFVGIGACSFDLEMYTAVLGYADSYWARREAPDENKVLAAVRDIDGTKPSYAKAVYKIGSMPADSTDGVAEGFNLVWEDSLAAIEFTQGINSLAMGMSPPLYVRVFHPEDGDNSTDGKMAASQMVWDMDVFGYDDFEVWMPPFIGPNYVQAMGWTTSDLDGGNVWETTDMFGPVALYHAGGTNDWIFMPSAILEQVGSYRLDGEVIYANNATIEMAWGTSPDPASMTAFATFSNVNVASPTGFATLAGGFPPYFNTPPVTGDYYVGIHLTGGEIAIDWIKLDKNPSPPPKIGYGFPGSDISTFIDDSSIPISITAIYKQPGKINKTYEVSTTTDIFGVNGDFLWDVETADSWITVTKAPADPTLQGFNFTPPRPRQFQTFTMTIDPSGLAPGLHVGMLRFYGVLFNDDFPPPAMGLTATNEIFEVPVHLRITTAGTKNGPNMVEATIGGLTVAGSPYHFIDGNSGATIASVEVTAGTISSLTVKAFPNQLPQNLARLMYVRRYWQIEYTGSGWMANITFPYAPQEASMVTDPTQLHGVRQPIPMGMWEDPIYMTTSVSDPANNAVTVNDLHEKNVGGNIALAHSYFIMTKNDAQVIPQAFGLEQNYPNPFNPSTAIVYNVSEERHVRLAVYNSLGAEVAVLVDEIKPAGQYTVDFDASDLTSGTYIYRMTAGDFVQTKRMTLSK